MLGINTNLILPFSLHILETITFLSRPWTFPRALKCMQSLRPVQLPLSAHLKPSANLFWLLTFHPQRAPGEINRYLMARFDKGPGKNLSYLRDLENLTADTHSPLATSKEANFSRIIKSWWFCKCRLFVFSSAVCCVLGEGREGSRPSKQN